MNWKLWINMYTLLTVGIKRLTDEDLLCSQGTLLNALWLPKWGGNPKKRGYM